MKYELNDRMLRIISNNISKSKIIHDHDEQTTILQRIDNDNIYSMNWVTGDILLPDGQVEKTSPNVIFESPWEILEHPDLTTLELENIYRSGLIVHYSTDRPSAFSRSISFNLTPLEVGRFVTDYLEQHVKGDNDRQG